MVLTANSMVQENTKAWALLSVSDKRGLEDIASALTQAGYGLLSTGGSAQALRAAGLTCAMCTSTPESRK